ncbi:hypothetical protein [Ideonella sp.]|uniref:hypothetical protein n=1 Tax=Ideonella sp. TaxID=1929293 RepID=UPI0035ADEAF2
MRPALIPTLAMALVACACTSYGPGGLQPGQGRAAVEADMGPPTGRHALAGGGERLEFARGPFGRHTYMLDFDAQGRLLRQEQVLRDDVFDRVQPGMRADAVRALLGRPGHVAGIWRGATVWSWRYESPFCQWFQVTLEPDGTVRDAGRGPDPLCETNDKDNLP